MTVKQRLTRSNICMFLVPLLIAAALLMLGAGVALYILEVKYLPQIGLSLQEMHITLEQYESMFTSFEAFVWIYLGAVGMALLLTICFTNFYLTRSLFRHISEPLDELVAGVERIQRGDLDSPIAYAASVRGKPLTLTNKEYELLFLARHPNQVFGREDLYELIWGLESMGENNTVAVHINRLREKIEEDPAKPQLIQTVWGVGYRLNTV